MADIAADARMQEKRLSALFVCAGVVIATGWLYVPTLMALVRHWEVDENYSHGFFVPPLAMYIAWSRRQQLLALPLRPAAIGALGIVGSLMCFAAGQFGAELFLTRISLIGLLASLVVFHFGWQHLRTLAFPLGCLFLMIPIPAVLFNHVAAPLQTLAAYLGEAAIALSGVPVLREGNVLMVPGRALEVAEACSGVRSLVSLTTLAVALGYFTEPRTGARVVLALSAIPIAVAVNAARVAGTGMATYWIGPAAADGFFHSFSGWLMFAAATGLLMLMQHICASARMPVLRPREVPC